MAVALIAFLIAENCYFWHIFFPSCSWNTIKNEILCSTFDMEVFRRILLALKQKLGHFRDIN